jgi:hypothetical protein
MKSLFPLLCALAAIVSLGCADDLIFFADDHYKAIGLPAINASVADPVLSLGESILRVTLANNGKLEELMPISGNGSKKDISKEMSEEMHSIDAQSITATLEGAGPISVISGPQHIESLPSGSIAEVAFNLTVGSGEGGWIEMPLRLDYERQVDVSVSDGEVSPLLQPDNVSLSVRVLVPATGPLRVLGTKSELYPGKSGNLMLVIKNGGLETLHNCSANLEAAPPFRVDGKESILGDLHPGSQAVAAFSVIVDGNAFLQDYQLGCRISSEEGRYLVSFPLALAEGGSNLRNLAIIAMAMLIGVAGAAFIFMKRKEMPWHRRRRW